MGWCKEKDREITEIFEIMDSADSLEIFTDYRNESGRECCWSYEFYSVINDEEFTLIKNESGNELICSCQECKDFGEDLFEYYGVFTTLTSIKKTFGKFRYCLWLNSDKFIKEASENAFEDYEKLYSCCFLQKLANQSKLLLQDVALVKYNTEPTAEGLPF